ncbi:twin-arginine translocation signal domain-containing protein [bacterium]|nr:MAG: twin-arginine translocation signal domain-containing protein [bacterium]
MRRKKSGMNRRDFLKRSAALGLGLMVAPELPRPAWGASKERITILNSSVTDTLNPYNHSSSPIYGMWQHIYEPLVEVAYNPVGYAGILAESWEFQGKKWVFHLRKGIRFHDGAPFTAQDVIFSINRIKTDKNSLQGENFKDVVEMQAADDHTVVFTLKQPNAVFLDRVQNRFIVSKAAAEKYGDQMDQHAIGTGPYKFVSFQRGGNFVVTRNDDYWGAKPEIKEIIVKKVTEEAARVAGLEAGQADVINNVPVHDVPRLERNSRSRVEKVEGLRMFFLALNPAFKPFDNKLVRQAVNYSVDANAIVKNIFEGNGFMLNGPLGPDVIGYDPGHKRYPYDPKKARELLARAGYPSGVEVKLYLSAGRYPQDREVCQVIAAQMEKGGFKVELVSQEWAVFWGLSGVNGGKLPFYYIGRGALVDADTLYDQYFRTGTTKRVSYSNPELDKLIEEEQKTGDNKKRVALLQQAGKILMEDVPFVPLYNLADLYGAARNVVWKARPDEKIFVWDMKIRS